MTRDRWRNVIRSEMRNLHSPGGERFWAPGLDAAPREQLRDIQGRKLVNAVEWMYGRSMLFRSKCDEIGLEPGDVRGIDDLVKLPITTKDDMSADLEANTPFGTYQSLTDEEWLHTGGRCSRLRERPVRRDRSVTRSSTVRCGHGTTRGVCTHRTSIRPRRRPVCFGYGPHVFMWGVHYGLNLMGVPIVPGGVDSHTRAGMIDR